MNHNPIPNSGYLRLAQIIGNSEVPGIIPVSRTTFLENVRTGRFPKPIKLSPRCTAWRVSDIRALMDLLDKGGK